MAKKTFIVRYPVVTYYAVEVEREEGTSVKDITESITRAELVTGEAQDDCAWDSIKEAWRDPAQAEVYVYDEDGCYEDYEVM